jgi:hypothetical protein
MTDAIAEEMTPVEYARKYGLTLGYIYSQIWAGRLPGAYKKGKQWRIPVSALWQRVSERAGTT